MKQVPVRATLRSKSMFNCKFGPNALFCFAILKEFIFFPRMVAGMMRTVTHHYPDMFVKRVFRLYHLPVEVSC